MSARRLKLRAGAPHSWVDAAAESVQLIREMRRNRGQRRDEQSQRRLHCRLCRSPRRRTWEVEVEAILDNLKVELVEVHIDELGEACPRVSTVLPRCAGVGGTVNGTLKSERLKGDSELCTQLADPVQHEPVDWEHALQRQCVLFGTADLRLGPNVAAGAADRRAKSRRGSRAETGRSCGRAAHARPPPPTSLRSD